jgi:hypothetical protein
MAYASQSGRARTSSRNPQAFAVCQRCGIWYNRVNLQFQFSWRGAQLQNTYILVCKECLDIPTEQLRAIVLPADPVPIFYPSVEQFQADEADYRATTVYPQPTDPVTGLPLPPTTYRVTQDCQNRALQPTGYPQGLAQNAVMPFDGGVNEAFGVVLPILSVIANGTCVITVTCSAVHNLQPNDQISAAGLSAANGFYTVGVNTATQFAYQTINPVPAASLMQGGSRIVTANAGLPLGYESLPL